MKKPKVKKQIKQMSKAAKSAIICTATVATALIIIALTAYLIWLIPDKFASLQTIITTIVAAIYGGLLTLLGVAWTIKHNEKQRLNEELAKAKPLFTFNIVNYKVEDATDRKLCFVYSNDNPSSPEEVLNPIKGLESFAEFENSNNSTFTIKRFYFENKWHKAFSNNVVLPNSKILIQIMRTNLIEHPIMEIEDIFERKFYYDLMFICLLSYQDIQFCSLSELKEITQQDLQKRNIPIE